VHEDTPPALLCWVSSVSNTQNFTVPFQELAKGKNGTTAQYQQLLFPAHAAASTCMGCSPPQSIPPPCTIQLPGTIAISAAMQASKIIHHLRLVPAFNPDFLNLERFPPRRWFACSAFPKEEQWWLHGWLV
jgi:hypothetical protein